MTDEQNTTEQAAQPDDESTGDAALDRRLAEPVLKGMAGLDTAQVWAGAFLVAMAGLVTYLGVLGAPFQREDQVLLRDNPAVHRITTFPEALNERADQPLTWFTLALNWRLAPGRAAGMRSPNLLLHLLTGVLLYLLCRRLLPGGFREPVAMLAGFIFVLHPAASESVLYAVGRSGPLAAALILLSLLMYTRVFRDAEGMRSGPLGWSLLFFVAAWAADGAAVLVPLLTLAFDWQVNGRDGWRRRSPALAAYWALLALLLLARGAALHAAGHDIGLFATGSLSGHLASMAGYARLLATPNALSVAHAAPVLSGGTLIVVTVVTVLCAAAGVWLLYRRVLPGFLLLWVIAAFILAAALRQYPETFADRRMYLALLPVSLLIPWAFTRLPARAPVRTVAGVLCAGLALACMGFTFARTSLWRDETALWADAVSKAPDSVTARRELGRALLGQAEASLQEMGVAVAENRAVEARQARERAEGLARAAAEQLERARAVGEASVGADADTLLLLGKALQYQGKGEEAVETLIEALRADTSSQECALRIAQILHAAGMGPDGRDARLRSLDYFERAARLGPLPDDALAAYGLALAAAGRLDAAQGMLSRATAGDEASPIRGRLREVAEAANQLRSARERAHTLLAGDASSREARRLTAQVFLMEGRMLQAAYALEGLLREDADDLDAWTLLGYARAAMGDPEAFLRDWPASPEPDDGKEGGWLRLARSCASRGMWDAALTYLESEPAREAGAGRPLVTAARVALQLNQISPSQEFVRRAVDYLRRATEAYPDDPEAWLVLADMAAAQNDAQGVGRLLAEAERRGAAPEDISRRRERFGPAPQDAPLLQPGEVFDAVIR